jgi:hypothetical protein
MDSSYSHLGLSLSTMLVNAGLTTFQKIEETNPREIELVITRLLYQNQYLIRWFISNCSGNENLLKLARVMAPSCPFYELQEQLQLHAQRLFFNKDTKMSIQWLYIRRHGILANQKPLTCIVVVQRCLFPSSQTCYFGKHTRKM